MSAQAAAAVDIVAVVDCNSYDEHRLLAVALSVEIVREHLTVAEHDGSASEIILCVGERREL